MSKLHWNENTKEKARHQANMLEREVEERNEREYISEQIGKLNISQLDEYGVKIKMFTTYGSTQWLDLTPDLAQRIMFIAQAGE